MQTPVDTRNRFTRFPDNLYYLYYLYICFHQCYRSDYNYDTIGRKIMIQKARVHYYYCAKYTPLSQSQVLTVSYRFSNFYLYTRSSLNNTDRITLRQTRCDKSRSRKKVIRIFTSKKKNKIHWRAILFIPRMFL